MIAYGKEEGKREEADSDRLSVKYGCWAFADFTDV
jgi:hypothetical protein